MNDDLVSTLADQGEPESESERIFGITVAHVVDNIDIAKLGRVQVELPWLPGVKPWARIAMPSAGKQRGIYFIPQVGDEVIVAFNHGDVDDPFVIGSLWNSLDPPPADQKNDPVEKRFVRTPGGHEVKFDDKDKSIIITSIPKHVIRIDSDKVEVALADDMGKLKLEKNGNITIEASKKLSLKAQSIELKAGQIEIKSDNSMSINGGSNCTIKAGQVGIN